MSEHFNYCFHDIAFLRSARFVATNAPVVGIVLMMDTSRKPLYAIRVKPKAKTC